MSSESGIDPRGPRFAAGITTVVLALVLLSGSGWLLAAQALVFAIGAFVGLQYSPYSALYRLLVAPRLGSPAERESPAPVRFSQAVGFAFAVVGTVGYLTGLTALGIVATAAALAAAFLNVAFDFCVGCEMYALLIRLTNRQPHSTSTEQGATA